MAGHGPDNPLCTCDVDFYPMGSCRSILEKGGTSVTKNVTALGETRIECSTGR